jgi:hypothetical protein
MDPILSPPVRFLACLRGSSCCQPVPLIKAGKEAPTPTLSLRQPQACAANRDPGPLPQDRNPPKDGNQATPSRNRLPLPNVHRAVQCPGDPAEAPDARALSRSTESTLTTTTGSPRCDDDSVSGAPYRISRRPAVLAARSGQGTSRTIRASQPHRAEPRTRSREYARRINCI